MSPSQATVDGTNATPRVALPLLQDSINQQLAAERQRLLHEAGLSTGPLTHFKRPKERPFTRAERDHTTVLIGGLTTRHDNLLLSGLHGLGYRSALLPTPVKADFQAGKEYGNNGQCNPTYFTVGNLVNYLKDLRDRQGVPTERILNDYVFVTAGTCGPCRFGMYEAEYRLALRNSGFDGFRVLLFDQTAGLEQGGGGIEFNLNLFLTLFNALFLGDLLNEVAYHIRPYEVVPGSTNEAFADALRESQEALKTKKYEAIQATWHTRILSKLLGGTLPPGDLAKFLDQLRSDHYTQVLRQIRDRLNERVDVDYTRPRPIVKVTGEFWAQTTEGEGNFRMFSFLEGEGAQVLVEPVATWVSYIVHSFVQLCRDERGALPNAPPLKRWDLLGRLRQAKRYRKLLFLLTTADRILKREYERLRQALGGTAHKLVNQLELQRMGHPYYNSRSEGGEGHMEVAKNIYYANHDLAHMVLSLKPFGCMPSTQSDGAQAAVVSHFPNMIFLPIETSGEGDINAYSRVQMALGEAKVKCKAEFKQALEQTGYTLDQIQAYIAEHRELRRPIQQIPHHKGVIGQAANFVLRVAAQMKAEGVRN
jgi:predicted nucleotide-binding protein (sugar kinase/HSP70/actin superfamily)